MTTSEELETGEVIGIIVADIDATSVGFMAVFYTKEKQTLTPYEYFSRVYDWIMKKALCVLGLLAIFFSGCGRDNWTLMVCSSLMENGIECRENSYVLDGYKTKNECMEKGLEVAKKDGFECGRNCKIKDSGMRVCGPICNRGGCQD